MFDGKCNDPDVTSAVFGEGFRNVSGTGWSSPVPESPRRLLLSNGGGARAARDSDGATAGSRRFATELLKLS